MLILTRLLSSWETHFVNIFLTSLWESICWPLWIPFLYCKSRMIRQIFCRFGWRVFLVLFFDLSDRKCLFDFWYYCLFELICHRNWSLSLLFPFLDWFFIICLSNCPYYISYTWHTCYIFCKFSNLTVFMSPVCLQSYTVIYQFNIKTDLAK